MAVLNYKVLSNFSISRGSEENGRGEIDLLHSFGSVWSRYWIQIEEVSAADCVSAETGFSANTIPTVDWFHMYNNILQEK